MEARSAPWGAKKGQKALPKRVPKMGSKKESKRDPKLRAFGMLKTFKSVVRLLKIMVLMVSEKYLKYD